MKLSHRTFPGPGILMIALLLCCLAVPSFCAASNAEKDLNFRSLQIRLINDEAFDLDTEKITQLFGHKALDYDIRAVASYFQHSESRLNYDQFLAPDQIRKAEAYMKQHQAHLAETEKAYGVDKEIITAIMLVETRLGTFVGKNSVFNVLATMAALEDPDIRALFWEKIPTERRISKNDYETKALQKARWAYRELKAFLTYVEGENFYPYDIQGSYAGAMGIAQFMPSNVLTLAVDGNKDGQINLFQHEDAISSIANYLKHHGWKPGIDREAAYKVILHYNRSKYYANTILSIYDKLKG